jgi:parallel beta-helix repeat protein
MRGAFSVPATAANGTVYRAAVIVSYSTFMLVYEPAVASLQVQAASLPTATPQPSPTATALPPTPTATTPAQPSPTATQQPSPTATATATATATQQSPPAAQESVLRVNAGGPTYVDGRGLTWSADGSFAGGSSYRVAAPVTGTSDATLYQSERWGSHIYQVPVANGSYDLRLMFAEIWFTRPGQRVFEVLVNGQPALSSFDILAETTPYTAHDKIVPVTVSNGMLRIDVRNGSADYGKLNAFELLRATGSTTPAPQPTATSTPAPSPTATSQPSPTATAQPSPTATASPSPSPTATQPQAPTTIQAMINAAAPGATVQVPAGTYREKIFINKPITLTGQPGAVIDGESRDRWIVGQASNVTIQGFTFVNSNQPQYHGGLSNDGYDNWTVRNNIFRDAGNAAIDIKQGSGHLIENNEVARSGNVGIRVESVGSATIRGNRTYGNNTKNLDPGWEAGGMKITGNYGGVRNLVIENNQAYSNNGPGIWIDVDGEGIEIRNNRVYDNSRAGIIYELSFNARIHGNVVYNNGRGFDAWGFGAGILIQNSSNVEVFNNVVAWNADGISVISQNRGESRWNNVTGNNVHDNSIIAAHDGGWNTYALAWLEDWNGGLASSSANNRGSGNRFWFTTAEGPELRYRWCSEGYWTVSDFSGSQGGQSSRYLSNAEKDQILAAAGL